MLMNHDEAAFAYLYDNYLRSLYMVVKTFIRDEDSANDALQDIFVNIFRKIDTYDSSKGRLYTWMSSIARNLCIDIVKSKGFRNDQRIKNAIVLTLHNGEFADPQRMLHGL